MTTLTPSRTPDYGSHPLRIHLPTRALVVLLGLAAACGSSIAEPQAPLDRFYFPTGIAVRGAPGASTLLVVSSNFDLRYGQDDGGSVLAVAPEGSPPGAVEVNGALRLPAYGGEIAVAESAPPAGIDGSVDACPIAAPLALVPSRVSGHLYAITLGAGGALSCGPECPLELPPGLDDPYGVAVACRQGRPPRAFVTHLRVNGAAAWLTEVDLLTGTQRSANFGLGPTHSAAYDRDTDRVYFTSGEAALTSSLRYVDVTPGCDLPLGLEACKAGALDLTQYLRGVDVFGIALSNPNVNASGGPALRRIYLTARLYDADLAASLGGRPGFDSGGVLITLEVEEGPFGLPVFRFIGAVSIGFGAGEVRVLPRRAGKRDLVAVTVVQDGVLWIYDDEAGAMARYLGRDPVTGKPGLGREPFGLAVQDLGGGAARIYVAAFDSSYVTPVDVRLDDPASAAVVMVADPSDPTNTRRITRRIGEERR